MAIDTVTVCRSRSADGVECAAIHGGRATDAVAADRSGAADGVERAAVDGSLAFNTIAGCSGTADGSDRAAAFDCDINVFYTVAFFRSCSADGDDFRPINREIGAIYTGDAVRIGIVRRANGCQGAGAYHRFGRTTAQLKCGHSKYSLQIDQHQIFGQSDSAAA